MKFPTKWIMTVVLLTHTITSFEDDTQHSSSTPFVYYHCDCGHILHCCCAESVWDQTEIQLREQDKHSIDIVCEGMEDQACRWHM